MTTFTLTDDEIVSLAFESGAVWPVPLPTVALDPDALASASRRGLRSLVARELVVGAEINPELRSLIAIATSGSGFSASYVTSRENPGAALGTATYVFGSEDSAVIDFCTAEGLHGLTAASAGHGADALVGLARNVFSQGFRGDDRGLLLVGRSDATGWFGIAQDEVIAGEIDGAGAFVPSSSREWSDTDLAAAVAR